MIVNRKCESGSEIETLKSRMDELYGELESLEEEFDDAHHVRRGGRRDHSPLILLREPEEIECDICNVNERIREMEKEIKELELERIKASGSPYGRIAGIQGPSEVYEICEFNDDTVSGMRFRVFRAKRDGTTGLYLDELLFLESDVRQWFCGDISQVDLGSSLIPCLLHSGENAVVLCTESRFRRSLWSAEVSFCKESIARLENLKNTLEYQGCVFRVVDDFWSNVEEITTPSHWSNRFGETDIRWFEHEDQVFVKYVDFSRVLGLDSEVYKCVDASKFRIAIGGDDEFPVLTMQSDAIRRLLPLSRNGDITPELWDLSYLSPDELRRTQSCSGVEASEEDAESEEDAASLLKSLNDHLSDVGKKLERLGKLCAEMHG